MKQMITRNALLMVILGLMSASVVQAKLPDEINRLYGGKNMVMGQILLKVPSIAEEGSMVNIGVKEIKPLARGEYVQEIAFYSDFRKQKPIARFRLGAQTLVDGLKLKVRLRDSSKLYAVARLNTGKLLAAEKFVKVTIGGCGGSGGQLPE